MKPLASNLPGSSLRSVGSSLVTRNGRNRIPGQKNKNPRYRDHGS
jgi:hypothetical protein